MLILVEVFVSMATFGEVYQVAEVVQHLLQYLKCELVCALSCLCEFLIVVTYLDLRGVEEQRVEG